MQKGWEKEGQGTEGLKESMKPKEGKGGQDWKEKVWAGAG